MKSIKTGSEGNGVSSEASEEAAAAPAEPIDFSKVEIKPLFKDFVDFETFSKSDFRAVKVLEFHKKDGEEVLNLLMVDPHIPAGAKLY